MFLRAHKHANGIMVKAKIVREEVFMATSKSQRIGIWVIAIAMALGTIGSFFAIILANDNAKVDQQNSLDAQKKMMEELAKSNKPLEGYEATPFDKDDVTELKVEVLKEGDGEALDAESTLTANYFGWTYDGKIFDSTNKDGTVTPIDFSLAGVIKGWTEGLTGQKVGSVVKLLIPADKAYGSVDMGDGRPFGPLAFIVEIKEKK